MATKEAALGRSSRSNHHFQVTIDTGLTGMRLDQFLAHHLPSVSRARIISSIGKGLILVDGVHRKSSYRLKENEILEGSVEGKPEIDVHPEYINFPILYEDDALLLISKPPGLIVHPGCGNHHGTLVNGLVYYCRSIAGVGDDLRPGIVHRLDKDTSGIMVVAKTANAHCLLVDSFKNRRLQKEYLALLHGVMKDKTGRIVAPIGRHPVQRQKMAIRPTGGKHAASCWEVVDEFDNAFSLVKVTIETGRTHQIRVHMAHLGFPVVGDTVYGAGKDNRPFPRQLLHASRLIFRHPLTAVLIDINAPIWPDFTEILNDFGWLGAIEEKNEYRGNRWPGNRQINGQ